MNPRKSTVLTSNAQPGELIVTLTLHRALFFVSPASGPTAAAKSSKMMFTIELSVENCALTVPDLQPLPSVSRSGSSTLTEVIVQAPLGGAVAVAAGIASTAIAERMRKTSVRQKEASMTGRYLMDVPRCRTSCGIYMQTTLGPLEHGDFAR
jgi:hypothetical protein